MNLKLNMKEINKIHNVLCISKGTLKMHFVFKMMRRNNTFLLKQVSMKLSEISLSCFHFSLLFSEGEVKSPCFLQVWWALYIPWFLWINLLKQINPKDEFVFIICSWARHVVYVYMFCNENKIIDIWHRA